MDDNLLNKPIDQMTDGDMKVPEKFLDPQTGELRTDALLKSYIALEKKLSQMGPSLADPEGRRRALKELGCPDCADDYDVDLSHGMFDLDPELNQRLYEKGFTNEQVQMLYDAAAEKLVPLVVELSAEFEADRELDRLVAEFGGAEKWQEVSRQLLAYGQKNLPADVLAGLAGSYQGVMALYRMMKTDQPAIDGGQDSAGGASENKLKTMMADPKYWKTKAPAYIAEVTKGFKTLYGE